MNDITIRVRIDGIQHAPLGQYCELRVVISGDMAERMHYGPPPGDPMMAFGLFDNWRRRKESAELHAKMLGDQIGRQIIEAINPSERR